MQDKGKKGEGEAVKRRPGRPKKKRPDDEIQAIVEQLDSTISQAKPPADDPDANDLPPLSTQQMKALAVLVILHYRKGIRGAVDAAARNANASADKVRQWLADDNFKRWLEMLRQQRVATLMKNIQRLGGSSLGATIYELKMNSVYYDDMYRQKAALMKLEMKLLDRKLELARISAPAINIVVNNSAPEPSAEVEKALNKVLMQ